MHAGMHSWRAAYTRGEFRHACCAVPARGEFTQEEKLALELGRKVLGARAGQEPTCRELLLEPFFLQGLPEWALSMSDAKRGTQPGALLCPRGAACATIRDRLRALAQR
jgi:hypothetical protein